MGRRRPGRARGLLILDALVSIDAAPRSTGRERGAGRRHPRRIEVLHRELYPGRGRGPDHRSGGEARVERHAGLGGTGVTYRALTSGAIDLYPEYTGTLGRVILKDPSLATADAIRPRLEAQGLTMSASLGFANTYALAVRGAQAERLGLRTIGDLAPHPDLSAAFSSGFLEREDGWPGLKRHYGLDLTPRLRDGARAHVSRAGRGPGRRHGRLLDGRSARAPAASPPRGRSAVLSRLFRGAAGAHGDRRAVSPHVDPAPRGARGADRRPPHGPAQRHGRSGRQARARGGGGLPRHATPRRFAVATRW